MSADYFFPCFVLFSLSGIFLWLAGAAAFFRENWLESLYRAPWLGYGILVGVLQLAHLFSPITRAASIIVLATVFVLASVILLAHLLRIRPNQESIGRRTALLVLLAVIAMLAFVPVFNCCTKEAFQYDLGLYYLKTIRWTETFSIVRGLVNLQPHLGFNQSAFLVTSVFDSLVPNRRGIFSHRRHPAMAGTFAIVVRHSSYSSFTVSEEAPARVRLRWPTPYPCLHGFSSFFAGNISSASPDSISFCLMLHFFIVFSCFTVSRVGEESRWRLGRDFLRRSALSLRELEQSRPCGRSPDGRWRKDLSSERNGFGFSSKEDWSS